MLVHLPKTIFAQYALQEASLKSELPTVLYAQLDISLKPMLPCVLPVLMVPLPLKEAQLVQAAPLVLMSTVTTALNVLEGHFLQKMPPHVLNVPLDISPHLVQSNVKLVFLEVLHHPEAQFVMIAQLVPTCKTIPAHLALPECTLSRSLHNVPLALVTNGLLLVPAHAHPAPLVVYHPPITHNVQYALLVDIKKALNVLYAQLEHTILMLTPQNVLPVLLDLPQTKEALTAPVAQVVIMLHTATVIFVLPVVIH